MAMNEVNLHMNAGSGDASYANNSAHQVLEVTLKQMFTDHGFPKCFKIADLGCSSGPNTLMIISYIKEKIEALCKGKNCRHPPEFEVFLNDLPQNDFNNLFKMLPSVGGMFVCGLPGSFYGRLLPSNSLNFVYSSYSLQWLSQVLEGVESNRENIHMAMASPGAVFEAYANQFERDFSIFLRLRGEEMLPGGHMVLIFVGRSVADPSTKDGCQHFTLLANTLVEMIAEGLIKEGDLHSFTFPIYTPCKQEVESIIRDEGSFNLDTIEGFRVPWDAHVGDKSRRGEEVSNFIRAYTEPVLAAHFGSSVIDDLYQRYEKKLGRRLSREEPSFNFILSLTKRNQVILHRIYLVAFNFMIMQIIILYVTLIILY